MLRSHHRVSHQVPRRNRPALPAGTPAVTATSDAAAIVGASPAAPSSISPKKEVLMPRIAAADIRRKTTLIRMASRAEQSTVDFNFNFHSD